MWRTQARLAKQPGLATSLWSSASISSQSLKSWPQRKRGKEGSRVGSSQQAQTAAGVSQELLGPVRCFYWQPRTVGWPSLCTGKG